MARKIVDWERVEHDYRAGLMTTREIGALYGVSHTAVGKRAKAYGWDRDLSAAIRAKADALVSKAEVSTEVANERAATERQIVEVNATVVAGIKIAHRKDIARMRALAMTMLSELEVQTGAKPILDQLADAMADDSPEGTTRRAAVLERMTATPGRIDSLKKLADAMKNLVSMEREAYGIVDTKQVEVIDKTPKGLSHFYANVAYPTAPDETTDDGDA